MAEVIECSICSVEVEEEDGGVIGFIGLLPSAFCPTCKAGIYDWACQQWGCEICGETPCECAPCEIIDET